MERRRVLPRAFATIPKRRKSRIRGGICGENHGQISDITFNNFKIMVSGGGSATKLMSLGGVFGRGTLRETSVCGIGGKPAIDAQNASRLSACAAEEEKSRLLFIYTADTFVG